MHGCHGPHHCGEERPGSLYVIGMGDRGEAPHVEVVLSNEKVLAYMEATLASTRGSADCLLTTVLAYAGYRLSSMLLRPRWMPPRWRTRQRAEQDAEAARRPRRKSQKERQREIKELNEKKAKKGSLRGVSEASLRDTTRSVPGTVDLPAAESRLWWAVGTCVRFLRSGEPKGRSYP